MTLLTLLQNPGATPPTPEPEPDIGYLGPSAGATVLQKRKPRKHTGASYSWEKFEKLMQELAEKDAALLEKAEKLASKAKPEKRKPKVVKQAELVGPLAFGALANATPAVIEEVETVVKAVTFASKAKSTAQMLQRTRAAIEAAERLERAIQDEEDVEALLMGAW